MTVKKKRKKAYLSLEAREQNKQREKEQADMSKNVTKKKKTAVADNVDSKKKTGEIDGVAKSADKKKPAAGTEEAVKTVSRPRVGKQPLITVDGIRAAFTLEPAELPNDDDKKRAKTIEEADKGIGAEVSENVCTEAREPVEDVGAGSDEEEALKGVEAHDLAVALRVRQRGVLAAAKDVGAVRDGRGRLWVPNAMLGTLGKQIGLSEMKVRAAVLKIRPREMKNDMEWGEVERRPRSNNIILVRSLAKNSYRTTRVRVRDYRKLFKGDEILIRHLPHRSEVVVG